MGLVRIAKNIKNKSINQAKSENLQQTFQKFFKLSSKETADSGSK